MKRKILCLFIAVQLAMGVMLTGCSGEKKNVAESKESVSQEKDEYFVWFLDGKGLGGLTDEGKKQEKLDIIEHEYNIPISQEFREDVRIMCNLSSGIEERATERNH